MPPAPQDQSIQVRVCSKLPLSESPAQFFPRGPNGRDGGCTGRGGEGRGGGDAEPLTRAHRLFPPPVPQQWLDLRDTES